MLFMVYGLLLKIAETISGPDRSGAVLICVNLRENGTWKTEVGSWL